MVDHQCLRTAGSRASFGSRSASSSATITASSSVAGRNIRRPVCPRKVLTTRLISAAVIARGVRAIPGLGTARGRSLHRLALSPVCWGVSALEDRGYQLHVERVLSEAAAVGEGAITAGPPGFLPDRSDQAKSLLRRNRLPGIAGHLHT